MVLDPLTIGMLAVLAILVFFMFRNSRKRQREAAELQQKVQVGADVMTNFGVFGTILDIDEENNKVQLETSPGTVLTVHRQVVTRVIDDHDADDSNDEGDTDTEASAAEPAFGASTTEPAFGERIEETAPDSKPTTSGPTASKTDKVDE
ncbi:preprotein translocase subunit YajC [Agreia bicolorata]|uniref:Preprotein translocase subunit YajC n=1 Tax=Agreia bicolorata TaxID=110935 RepID=A0A1T4X6U3_9MICO|nr:preprotein translocase subunit YajC [Agreia bicolorata]SKA85137.1 preprotein translocase subunit YajC [Agreia bicolorata]